MTDYLQKALDLVERVSKVDHIDRDMVADVYGLVVTSWALDHQVARQRLAAALHVLGDAFDPQARARVPNPLASDTRKAMAMHVAVMMLGAVDAQLSGQKSALPGAVRHAVGMCEGLTLAGCGDASVERFRATLCAALDAFERGDEVDLEAAVASAIADDGTALPGGAPTSVQP